VFMQKLRRWTKKHRVVLMIVVALLTVGLIGSFAVWRSDYGQAGNTTMTAQEQVAVYEDYLADVLPASVQEATYEEAREVAALYADMFMLYRNASSELLNQEEVSEKDQAAATEYNEKATDAALQSVLYFQQAIDTAPAELNEAGYAQLYASLALNNLYAGLVEAAGEAIATALEYAPEDIFVISVNAEYIASAEGYDAAIAYLEPIMAGYDEESSEYKNLSGQLQQYQMIASLLDAMEESAQDTDEEAAE